MSAAIHDHLHAPNRFAVIPTPVRLNADPQYTGKGVTIHTVECDTLESFADTPERWLDVSWGEADEQAARVSRVSITIFNRQGALGAITNIVAKHGGNITNFKITNRSPDFWDLYMDVAVNDVDHLNSIIAALRSSPHVSDADQAKS